MIKSTTTSHDDLKRLALDWARQEGYTCCAFEVRVPTANYRADMVAYRPATETRVMKDPATGKTRKTRVSQVGQTAIFECKSSRADLLNDVYPRKENQEKLKELHERRIRLEEMIKVHYPNLLKGESLFPEFDVFDPGKIRHAGYENLIRKIAILENRVMNRTKFDNLHRYHSANLYYLVASDGIIEPHEVPSSWGLLLSRGNKLHLLKKAIFQEVDVGARLALLHQLAACSTRRLHGEHPQADYRLPGGSSVSSS